MTCPFSGPVLPRDYINTVKKGGKEQDGEDDPLPPTEIGQLALAP